MNMIKTNALQKMNYLSNATGRILTERSEDLSVAFRESSTANANNALSSLIGAEPANARRTFSHKSTTASDQSDVDIALEQYPLADQTRFMLAHSTASPESSHQLYLRMPPAAGQPGAWAFLKDVNPHGSTGQAGVHRAQPIRGTTTIAFHNVRLDQLNVSGSAQSASFSSQPIRLQSEPDLMPLALESQSGHVVTHHSGDFPIVAIADHFESQAPVERSAANTDLSASTYELSRTYDSQIDTDLFDQSAPQPVFNTAGRADITEFLTLVGALRVDVTIQGNRSLGNNSLQVDAVPDTWVATESSFQRDTRGILAYERDAGVNADTSDFVIRGTTRFDRAIGPLNLSLDYREVVGMTIQRVEVRLTKELGSKEQHDFPNLALMVVEDLQANQRMNLYSEAHYRIELANSVHGFFRNHAYVVVSPDAIHMTASIIDILRKSGVPSAFSVAQLAKMLQARDETLTATSAREVVHLVLRALRTVARGVVAAAPMAALFADSTTDFTKQRLRAMSQRSATNKTKIVIKRPPGNALVQGISSAMNQNKYIVEAKRVAQVRSPIDAAQPESASSPEIKEVLPELNLRVDDIFTTAPETLAEVLDEVNEQHPVGVTYPHVEKSSMAVEPKTPPEDGSPDAPSTASPASDSDDSAAGKLAGHLARVNQWLAEHTRSRQIQSFAELHMEGNRMVEQLQKRFDMPFLEIFARASPMLYTKALLSIPSGLMDTQLAALTGYLIDDALPAALTDLEKFCREYPTEPGPKLANPAETSRIRSDLGLDKPREVDDPIAEATDQPEESVAGPEGGGDGTVNEPADPGEDTAEEHESSIVHETSQPPEASAGMGEETDDADAEQSFVREAAPIIAEATGPSESENDATVEDPGQAQGAAEEAKKAPEPLDQNQASAETALQHEPEEEKTPSAVALPGIARPLTTSIAQLLRVTKCSTTPELSQHEANILGNKASAVYDMLQKPDQPAIPNMSAAIGLAILINQRSGKPDQPTGTLRAMSFVKEITKTKQMVKRNIAVRDLRTILESNQVNTEQDYKQTRSCLILDSENVPFRMLVCVSAQALEGFNYKSLAAGAGIMTYVNSGVDLSEDVENTYFACHSMTTFLERTTFYTFVILSGENEQVHTGISEFQGLEGHSYSFALTAAALNMRDRTTNGLQAIYMGTGLADRGFGQYSSLAPGSLSMKMQYFERTKVEGRLTALPYVQVDYNEAHEFAEELYGKDTPAVGMSVYDTEESVGLSCLQGGAPRFFTSYADLVHKTPYMFAPGEARSVVIPFAGGIPSSSNEMQAALEEAQKRIDVGEAAHQNTVNKLNAAETREIGYQRQIAELTGTCQRLSADLQAAQRAAPGLQGENQRLREEVKRLQDVAATAGTRDATQKDIEINRLNEQVRLLEAQRDLNEGGKSFDVMSYVMSAKFVVNSKAPTTSYGKQARPLEYLSEVGDEPEIKQQIVRYKVAPSNDIWIVSANQAIRALIGKLRSARKTLSTKHAMQFGADASERTHEFISDTKEIMIPLSKEILETLSGYATQIQNLSQQLFVKDPQVALLTSKAVTLDQINQVLDFLYPTQVNPETGREEAGVSILNGSFADTAAAASKFFQDRPALQIPGLMQYMANNISHHYNFVRKVELLDDSIKLAAKSADGPLRVGSAPLLEAFAACVIQLSPIQTGVAWMPAKNRYATPEEARTWATTHASNLWNHAAPKGICIRLRKEGLFDAKPVWIESPKQYFNRPLSVDYRGCWLSLLEENKELGGGPLVPRGGLKIYTKPPVYNPSTVEEVTRQIQQDSATISQRMADRGIGGSKPAQAAPKTRARPVQRNDLLGIDTSDQPTASVEAKPAQPVRPPIMVPTAPMAQPAANPAPTVTVSGPAQPEVNPWAMLPSAQPIPAFQQQTPGATPLQYNPPGNLAPQYNSAGNPNASGLSYGQRPTQGVLQTGTVPDDVIIGADARGRADERLRAQGYESSFPGFFETGEQRLP